MSKYQNKQISHLQAIGWNQAGSNYLPGAGRNKGEILYRLTNQSGHRAYIHSTWTQYII